MLNLFLIKHRNAALKLGGPYREQLEVGIDEPLTITIPWFTTVRGVVSHASSESGPVLGKHLLALIKRDLKIARGRSLQVLVCELDRSWSMKKCRDEQQANGFDGNAAACLMWAKRVKPRGWFISIANSDDRLVRDGGDILYAPCFYRKEGTGSFFLHELQNGSAHYEGRVSVSFKVVS